MKNFFLLLTIGAVFLGFASLASADTAGFGVSLPNPLCIQGSSPKCANGAWRLDSQGPNAPDTPSWPSEAACNANYENPCVSNLPDLISVISGYVAGIIGSIAVLMFIWAGFLFLTSAGDPGKSARARQVVLYAVIGVAVALAASGLILVIQSVIGPGPS